MNKIVHIALILATFWHYDGTTHVEPHLIANSKGVESKLLEHTRGKILSYLNFVLNARCDNKSLATFMVDRSSLVQNTRGLPSTEA